MDSGGPLPSSLGLARIVFIGFLALLRFDDVFLRLDEQPLEILHCGAELA